MIPRAIFRSAERLKRDARFRAIRQRGVWVKGATLAVGTLPNSLPHIRLGIRIQHGLRGAVERNCAKRVVRELYRANKAMFGTGRDVLVVLKRIDGLRPSHITEELSRLCSGFTRTSQSARESL